MIDMLSSLPISLLSFLGVFCMLLLVLAIVIYVISFFVDKKLKEKLKKGAIVLLIMAIVGVSIYIFLPPILKLLGI